MKRTGGDSATDLEGATLAFLAREGGATSYAVARAFARSPSEFWSGSAGAVYPMLRRMAARGWVKGKAGREGERRSTIFSITASGRAALMAWLLDSERAAGMGFDPLRTRLVFLDLAPAGARAKFLKHVAERTQALKDGGAQFERAHEQRLHASWLSARLGWIGKLRA